MERVMEGIGLKYTMYMYENCITKPTSMVFKVGKGDKKGMEGGGLIKYTACMH
jgi:hypothetical protein